VVGSTDVATGADRRSSMRAFDSRAIRSCSESWKKITDRYWLPTSTPCRSTWVGSWISQNFSTSSP